MRPQRAQWQADNSESATFAIASFFSFLAEASRCWYRLQSSDTMRTLRLNFSHVSMKPSGSLLTASAVAASSAAAA